jgi:molecular chaperone IbpA
MNSLVKEIFGFDPFADHIRSMNELVKAAYPKYNLVKNEDGSFSLEIAVAGFRKEDLSVEQRNSSLLIEGKSPAELRNYLHKGISSKPFRLMFPLSVDWKLKSASLFDGILKFTFVTKEAEKSQRIEITTAPEALVLDGG